MATKKRSRKTRAARSKKSPRARRAAGRTAKRKTSSQGAHRKTRGRGSHRSARAIPPRTPLRPEESIEGLPETPGSSLSSFYRFERAPHAGPHPEAAGQAGDTESLRKVEIDAPQSVEELVEEGQDYEAEIVDAVENVPPADVSAVPRPKQPKARSRRPPTL